MRKKECVAMLLAGGEGKRLGRLTANRAKPAVHFGGKYRIIDFPLSNCTNSGIDTVGVLTQYQPLDLHTYIGNGRAWDLDRQYGGLTVLPPYVRQGGADWYSGTANAVYQNFAFIEQYQPIYVLILSGDHIYKMDYNALLQFHKEKKAEATISVIEVPWEEAYRFGIMRVDEHGRIQEFYEKPSRPISNLASMGVYLFNWENLKYILQQDYLNSTSSHDFGKDIIPSMLKEGRRLFAYPFYGYWKDVGTIESLWEANMDLLADEPELDLYDPGWRIYSVNPGQPPHYTSPSARVTRSLVNEGCTIYGNVEHSILFYSVTVGKNALVRDSVIMPYAHIGEDVTVERTIVGEGAVIEDGSTVGKDQDKGIYVIGNGQIVSSPQVMKDRAAGFPE